MSSHPTVSMPFPRARRYGPDEHRAVLALLEGDRLSETGRGAAVGELEDAFAALVGTSHALSFNSGTAALHAALHAAGANQHAGVAVAPMTWISALTAVFHAGSFPIFCDIEPDSPNLAAPTIANEQCAAVLVTHAWGIPARMDTLTTATDRPVVEDCSHAHGAVYAGRPVGSWGAAGCFSLQETKAVSGGEGGILTTSGRDIYERALTVGHHPHRLSAELTLPELLPLVETGAAYKYRMPALAAVIARQQLRDLPQRMAAAEANLDILRQIIDTNELPVTLPAIGDSSVRGWYGTPLYINTPADASQALFRDCITEGLPLRAQYPDWLRTPLLQRPDLLHRFWPHVRSTAYRPPDPHAYPQYYRARRQMLVLKVPHIAAPDYMEQVGTALIKILTRTRPGA